MSKSRCVDRCCNRPVRVANIHLASYGRVAIYRGDGTSHGILQCVQYLHLRAFEAISSLHTLVIVT